MSSTDLPPGVSDSVAAYVSDAITDAMAPAAADLNAGFVLASGYLVFFMHCGFAMLSIGCVRARFAKHIAILILVDACASAIGFYALGYAFAFGDDQAMNSEGTMDSTGNSFAGTNYFFMSHLPFNTFDQSFVSYWLWLFQWAFAATACTIVSGAIAERARFESYAFYSLFMAAWVYPIVVHASWSSAGWASAFRQSTVGGLLFGSGIIDFAGSGVVHMVGGYAAAAGCWILGPRIGRFLSDGTVVDMAGHNTSLFVLGVMILWFGWYGFNPGSQLAIVGNSAVVSNAAVTTTIAAASAGLSGLLFRALLLKKETGRYVYDLMTMGNATLAGLVAITAGCSVVYPWAAVVIGGFAGILYCIGSKVSVFLKLDDPLDAIAVHAWNGTWGVFAVGFLAAGSLVTQTYGPKPGCKIGAFYANSTEIDTNLCGSLNLPDTCTYSFTVDDSGAVSSGVNCQREFGCFLGGSGRLLAAQVIHIIWIAAWVLGNMIPFFFILSKLGWFRVDPADETAGLDDSYHGGSAYPGHGLEGEKEPRAHHHGALEELKAELAALKAHVHGNGATTTTGPTGKIVA